MSERQPGCPINRGAEYVIKTPAVLLTREAVLRLLGDPFEEEDVD